MNKSSSNYFRVPCRELFRCALPGPSALLSECSTLETIHWIKSANNSTIVDTISEDKMFPVLSQMNNYLSANPVMGIPQEKVKQVTMPVREHNHYNHHGRVYASLLITMH